MIVIDGEAAAWAVPITRQLWEEKIEETDKKASSALDQYRRR